MQGTLFISDLHLDTDRPAVLGAFLTFLDQLSGQADALYILGDLFEAWVGDDDASALANSVSVGLRSLSDSGVPVWLMHGNRDFLIGEEFCARAGCQLLPDPSTISLYGEKTLLMHGDSLCTDDKEYMEFRATMRQPDTQAQLLALPIEERRQLARELRSKSSEAMSNKAEDILDVTPSAVTSIMQEHQLQRLIHGHTHRPSHHYLGDGKGERIVLGDWDTDLWFLQVSEQGLQLRNQTIAAGAPE